MKKLFQGAALAFFVAVLMLSPVLAEAAAKGLHEFVVFHTNDMHARMVKGDDNGNAVGLAEMSAAVRAGKAKNPDTLWLDAGDTLHGMPSINVSRGMNAVELLNESCMDAFTPGNHDFNYGSDQLEKLAKKMKPTVLSANVVRKGTGKRVFKDYKIYKFSDGLRVGVFGLTTPEAAYKTSPANVATIQFLNPVDTAREMVRELRPKCDVIVALMHMGLDASSEYTSERIAKEAPGIDLIVDGHSHTTLPEGLMVGDTMIVQTGWHEYKLGRVTITLEDGKITKKSAELLNAEGVAQLAPTPDANIKKTMDAIEKRNEKLFNEVVAHTERGLSGDREIIRQQEAELGNLCADAFRWRTGADIGIINGGGMRTDLPEGDVTRGDVMAIFPFGNTVQKKEITGAKVRAMLEHSVFGYPASFGGFLDVSGITFSFDPSMPAGHRVSDVKIGGEPLDDSKTYTIGATDFMFVGGDDYEMLKDLPTLGEFGTCEEIIADYLNQVGMKGIETGRIKVLNDVITSEASGSDEQQLDMAA